MNRFVFCAEGKSSHSDLPTQSLREISLLMFIVLGFYTCLGIVWDFK